MPGSSMEFCSTRCFQWTQFQLVLAITKFLKTLGTHMAELLSVVKQ